MTICLYKYLAYERRVRVFCVEIDRITLTAQTILGFAALGARVFDVVLINLSTGFLIALKDLVISTDIERLRSRIIYEAVFVSL